MLFLLHASCHSAVNQSEAWNSNMQTTCPGLLRNGMGESWTHNLRVTRQNSFHWATAPCGNVKALASHHPRHYRRHNHFSLKKISLQMILLFVRYCLYQVPCLLYHGDLENRAGCREQIFGKAKKFFRQFVSRPVVITSYEIVMRDTKFLRSNLWRLVIVDEGHRIRNVHSRLIRCATPKMPSVLWTEVFN